MPKELFGCNLRAARGRGSRNDQGSIREASVCYHCSCELLQPDKLYQLEIRKLPPPVPHGHRCLPGQRVQTAILAKVVLCSGAPRQRSDMENHPQTTLSQPVSRQGQKIGRSRVVQGPADRDSSSRLISAQSL